MPSDQPVRGFATSEFETRTLNAQRHMADQNIAGMLLTCEPDIRYFTGFQTLFWQSPTRPWFVFVPAEGKPIALIPEIGAALMRATWIDDIRTWAAPTPKDDGITLLVDLLAPLAERGKTLGILKGHETHLRMPLGDWERLTSALPGLKVADVTNIVQGLRMVKSEAEIAKLRHVSQIGSETFAQVPEFAHVGQPLEDTFRAFRREALSQGADDVPYLVGAAALDGYEDVISPPTQRPLQKGDVLMMDTGCTWDGYFCDFDRNWAVHSASDQAKTAYETLWTATEAALAAARAGNSTRDLFDAMAKVIAEISPDQGDVGRLGHGLGMQLTEQPSLAHFDATELIPNMVLTLEPSVTYGPGLMMVHEENIVIRDGEPELLSTRAPVELPII